MIISKITNERKGWGKRIPTSFHLEAVNSLTEIARCPYDNGEVQKAQIHHGLIASAIMKQS